jgi:GT2 family glycosyltransferase
MVVREEKVKKKIAVIICNWNKKDDVIKCIHSVLQTSNHQLFDLYIVDNASTDGSVEAIREIYSQEEVVIIRNKENLGGSGGFNKGISAVLDKDYKYIMLLDNDVYVDKNSIDELFDYMEENQMVAAVGSKLYLQNRPGYLQEFGSFIDWENFNNSPMFKNEIDSHIIPTEIECDYIPACSVMIRSSVIKEIGLMNESCFIYWDDIEWFYRMKRKGYKIIVNSKSKAWHKMGSANRSTTFPTYYFWRNRIDFFLRYIQEDQVDKFTKQIVSEMTRALFINNYNKTPNIGKTILFALEDALSQKRGKALDDRIQIREQVDDHFEMFIEKRKNLLIYSNGQKKLLSILMERLAGKANVYMLKNDDLIDYIQSKDTSIKILDKSVCSFSTINLMNHVLEIKAQKNSDFYIDNFLNMVDGSNYTELLSSYHEWEEISKNIYYPVLLQRFKEWRQLNSNSLLIERGVN